MGRGVPLPNRLGGLGSVVSSPSGVRAEPRPKTNLVHFVASRMTLIAIVSIILSAVMYVETHTAKHEHQKCDHVYIHTPHTRAFFQTINLQYAGCGQAGGVKPMTERRGGTLA